MPDKHLSLNMDGMITSVSAIGNVYYKCNGIKELR